MHGRKKASTRALLGDKYIEDTTQVPPRPKPLEKAEDYTVERVKDGLSYADCVLRLPTRKFSPVGHQAMRVHKDCIVDYLQFAQKKPEDATDAEYEDVKNDYLALIRSFEESAEFRYCLRVLTSEDEQDLQQRLLEFKTMLFYARYGDIFADVCKYVKGTAEKKKIPGWELLQGSYWTTTHNTIKLESTAWKSGKVTGNFDTCPTSVAVYRACLGIAVDPNEVFAAIEHYAERNEIVHSDFDELIRDGKWYTLAARLVKDRTELYAVLPPTASLHLNIVGKAIDSMIDRLFMKDPLHPEGVERWIRSEEAAARSEELLADVTKKKSKIAEQVVKDVLKKMRKDRKAWLGKYGDDACQTELKA